LAFAAWQKKQVWVIEGIQDEDDEDVDALTPAPPIPAAAIDATIITPATAIPEPRNKPPPKVCPPTPEKPRREELRLQPLPETFDVSNSWSAEAVAASNADRERKRDIAERASTRFHFKNSDVGKQQRALEAAAKKAEADEKKLRDYDILSSKITELEAKVVSLK